MCMCKSVRDYEDASADPSELQPKSAASDIFITYYSHSDCLFQPRTLSLFVINDKEEQKTVASEANAGNHVWLLEVVDKFNLFCFKDSIIDRVIHSVKNNSFFFLFMLTGYRSRPRRQLKTNPPPTLSNSCWWLSGLKALCSLKASLFPRHYLHRHVKPST